MNASLPWSDSCFGVTRSARAQPCLWFPAPVMLSYFINRLWHRASSGWCRTCMFHAVLYDTSPACTRHIPNSFAPGTYPTPPAAIHMLLCKLFRQHLVLRQQHLVSLPEPAPPYPAKLPVISHVQQNSAVAT